MGRAYGTHERDEKRMQNFGQKSVHLEKPRYRWEDNIRMDIREIGWEVWTGCIWLKRGTNGRLL
jgi:hypothetical protein